MKNLMKQWDGTIFPEMIRDLPEIDIKTNGVRGWLLENSIRQVVFFDIQPVGKIPPPLTLFPVGDNA